MARERSSWLVVLCLAVGAAAIVLAWLPSAWPNPLGSGEVDAARALPQLRPVTVAVDAACADGDDRAFAAATTAAYREDLGQRLQAVDGALDRNTLRAMGASNQYSQWLTRPVLAAHVAGTRAAIAVTRPAGDGAQLLTFVWNGERFLFDGNRHLVGVTRVAEATLWVAKATRGNGSGR